MTKECIKSLGPNCGFDTLKPSGKKQKQKQNRSPQRNSYYQKESVLDTFQNNQREGALESGWRYKGNKMNISTPVNKEVIREDHTGSKELRSQPVQR